MFYEWREVRRAQTDARVERRGEWSGGAGERGRRAREKREGANASERTREGPGTGGDPGTKHWEEWAVMWWDKYCVMERIREAAAGMGVRRMQ